MIGENFPHLSSQRATRLGRFKVIFPLIFFIFLHIYLQNLGPKGGGEEGQISRKGLADLIFTPGVELGVFPSPTEAYD